MMCRWSSRCLAPCDPDRWYAVDPAIVEENQEDPRESPDGAAHACVVGGMVVRYTGGGGT